MVDKFFDATCSIGTYASQELEFHTVQELVSNMDCFGIESAVVHHNMAVYHDAALGNYKLLKEVKPFRERLFPSWVYEPELSWGGNLNKFINEMQLNGIKAVRIYPTAHKFQITRWNVGDVFDAFDDARLLVYADPWDIDFSMLQSACETYCNIKFILTNPSYYFQRMLYPLLNMYPNLYVELSTYLVFGGIDELIGKFGADRILFGTGMPFHDPGGAIAATAYANASDEQKNQIAYGNLGRLLNDVKF